MTSLPGFFAICRATLIKTLPRHLRQWSPALYRAHNGRRLLMSLFNSFTFYKEPYGTLFRYNAFNAWKKEIITNSRNKKTIKWFSQCQGLFVTELASMKSALNNHKGKASGVPAKQNVGCVKIILRWWILIRQKFICSNICFLAHFGAHVGAGRGSARCAACFARRHFLESNSNGIVCAVIKYFITYLASRPRLCLTNPPSLPATAY